jgi:predicted  nucleic acid-binding Zn-ribbon protein
MTDKELRRLSRLELVELLLEQSRRVSALEKQLQEANEKLNKREILLHEAGNIAEAALRLNHIFEDAQAASEQYMQGVQDLMARQSAVSATESPMGKQ